MELSFGQHAVVLVAGFAKLPILFTGLSCIAVTVVQRSQHSFDPFPDHGRVLPFWEWRCNFYNYMIYHFTILPA